MLNSPGGQFTGVAVADVHSFPAGQLVQLLADAEEYVPGGQSISISILGKKKEMERKL